MIVSLTHLPGRVLCTMGPDPELIPTEPLCGCLTGIVNILSSKISGRLIKLAGRRIHIGSLDWANKRLNNSGLLRHRIWWNMAAKRKAFTLVELLVVISII